VLTVEELVRATPERWAGKIIVVRGRLSFASGRPLSFRPTAEPSCGAAIRMLSLEAEVEGACYAVDLGQPGCWGDASRVCCNHLPLGEEVAASGRLSTSAAGDPFVAELGHVARLCRLGGAPHG
jgi:hypothetical protein